MFRVVIRSPWLLSQVSLVIVAFGSSVKTGLSQPTAGFLYEPQTYTCQKVDPLSAPLIDGNLGDGIWAEAQWTTAFVDIEGNSKPAPKAETRCKMLWDTAFFYVACQLYEKDIWATYKEHDMVIFHENDIELFIDPDKDTHQYFEFEMNALGTHWDLMLTKPYRDGGRAVDAWDIKGLKKGVNHHGTINVTGDRDTSWTVELAIPWSVLEEGNLHPGPPNHGEVWKMNFSRVQWEIQPVNGIYQKVKDQFTGKNLPENNWVWSSQGRIDMHQPETWGLVVFSEAHDNAITGEVLEEDHIRWQLRQVYYDQRRFFQLHQSYSSDFSSFQKDGIQGFVLGSAAWLAQKCVDGYCYFINQDGRVWQKPKK